MFAAVGKGVVLVGSDEATLKQGIDTREGGDALADSSDYKATLDKLSGDNAAIVYVNGKEVGQLLQLALASGAAKGAGAAAGALGQSQAQLASLRGIGVALGADASGLRVRAVALGASGFAKVADVEHDPALRCPRRRVRLRRGRRDRRVPEGPVRRRAERPAAAAPPGHRGADGPLAPDRPAGAPRRRHHVYAAPGTPLRGGLVLHPSDAAKAADVMHKITAAAAKFADVHFTRSPAARARRRR